MTSQMMNELPTNHHKAVQSSREGANFLYLILAQIANPSICGHSDDTDNDGEGN